MIIDPFNIDDDLKAFIAGFSSRATANVLISHTFTTGDSSAYPSSPDGERRSLVFSESVSGEYQVVISNVDGTSSQQITVPR